MTPKELKAANQAEVDARTTPKIYFMTARAYHTSARSLMKNPIPNAPSCWVAYVLVDDLKKAVEKANVLGGTVMKDETQVKDKGSFAIMEDPTGAMLGLWESTK